MLDGLVAGHVEDELLVGPQGLLEQRAELAVDLADEEAELVEALLHLADLRAGHAAAERLRQVGRRPRGLRRLDHDRRGDGNGRRRWSASTALVDADCRVVAAVAPEAAGDAGDDDRADHRDGGERGQRSGRRRAAGGGGRRRRKGEVERVHMRAALPAGQPSDATVSVRRLDRLQLAAQADHLGEDRADHAERAQRRLAAGAREVVDAELLQLEARAQRPDDQLGVDERPLAAQLDRCRARGGAAA